MKFFFLAGLFLISYILHAQETVAGNANGKECLMEAELQLAKAINAYRAEKRLPAIELSASLSHVAQLHCMDLAESDAYSGKCNLHSWSGHGKWTSCCYTPDHKQASCMWDKPRELTSYAGDGFEIAYFSTSIIDSPAAYASEILQAWKGSPGHNDIIVNNDKWDRSIWKAMGIGIRNGYATVWFGKEPDPAGKPDICN
jgi:hypothetical protein